MKKIFIYLIASSLTLYSIQKIIPFIDHLWISPEIAHILEFSGYGANIPYTPILYWSMFFIWLATSIGMLLFSKIARTIYAGLVITSLLLIPHWGISIYTAHEAFLVSIIQTLDGAILIMAYFTSVSHEFSNKYKQQEKKSDH